MTKILRVIFAGTPDFAAGHLRALLDDGRHEVVAVYCQPDRPAGRGKKLLAGPVKQLALENGIPVHQPLNFRAAQDLNTLRSIDADIMVVVAYGLLLPQAVLDIPRLGCINVHGSLLPRWRGAAPIQRALEAGDTETGITIMQMDAGLDTGPMLLCRSIAIAAAETGGSLHDRLLDCGCDALTEALDHLAAGTLTATPQPEAGSCYASKITKEEMRINWQQPAPELARKIRAFNPFPVCYSELADARVKIWNAIPVSGSAAAAGTIVAATDSAIDVACGEDLLRITKLQLAGGKALPVKDVLNARAGLFQPGLVFSQ